MPEENNFHLESPLKITISYTHTCNLDCRYCYADCKRSDVSKEMSREDWLKFGDYLDNNGFVQVFLEGGEPLLRPDFMAFVEYCGRRMLTCVRTNGTLVTPEVAEQFRAYGVETVCVDIMGATAATHEGLTQGPGSFEAACRAVRLLRAQGISVIMTIILNRENVAELQQYLELASELDANSVGILRLYPLGRAYRNWEQLALPLEAQMAAIRSLRPPAGLKIMQSWHPNDGNCCWQSAAVNAFGDSIGCVYLRDFVNFGNIQETPFLETWKDPLYREIRSGKTSASCSECSGSQGSHGGCRSTAFAFHGRWDAPDPYCSNLNGGVDVSKQPRRALSQGRELEIAPRE